MVIDTPAGSLVTVTSNWFSVWYAAEHATARCVRAGRGGNISVKGAITGGQPRDILRVSIMDEPAHLALPEEHNGTLHETKTGGSV